MCVRAFCVSHCVAVHCIATKIYVCQNTCAHTPKLYSTPLDLLRTHTCTTLVTNVYRQVVSPKNHCNTLQHTATHCNTLQRIATHCNTLQHTATHCNTLQYTATHCNTLQHTATHCNTLQHTATHCNTLQHTATRCITLPHIATHDTQTYIDKSHSPVWHLNRFINRDRHCVRIDERRKNNEPKK